MLTKFEPPMRGAAGFPLLSELTATGPCARGGSVRVCTPMKRAARTNQKSRLRMMSREFDLRQPITRRKRVKLTATYHDAALVTNNAARG